MWYNPTFKEHVIATLKVLFIIAIGFILMITFSCQSKLEHYDTTPNPQNFIMTNKYKVGDVVYLKPDSTKALINKVGVSYYTIHKGSKQNVFIPTICGEESIYGKE